MRSGEPWDSMAPDSLVLSFKTQFQAVNPLRPPRLKVSLGWPRLPSICSLTRVSNSFDVLRCLDIVRTRST
eukprot:s246_g40.t1